MARTPQEQLLIDFRKAADHREFWAPAFGVGIISMPAHVQSEFIKSFAAYSDIARTAIENNTTDEYPTDPSDLWVAAQFRQYFQ